MSEFAKNLLKEQDLVKKVELITNFQRKEDVFFDTTVIFKAEIAKMFIETMNISVDKNLVLTACLVYSFKKQNNPKEIDRVKEYKKEDLQYLKSLGFDERFCKICSEYNRYDEPKNYIREKEGDLIEIVDQFVGMLTHRQDRLAYSVQEAVDLLENKNLKGCHNQYLEPFKEFVDVMEGFEV